MQIPFTSQTLDAAEFYSLSLVQVGHEWQANLQVERGDGWRVCMGSTPSEALAACLIGFVPESEGPPPCPVSIPLPPC